MLVTLRKDPSARELRLFGAVWLPLAMVLLTLRAPPSLRLLPVAVAAASLLAGLLRPRALRLVYVGLMYATYPIAFVVGHVLLGAVFFLAIVPIGLIRRALGHDTMGRSFDRRATTYWMKRPPKVDPERYFRQY